MFPGFESPDQKIYVQDSFSDPQHDQHEFVQGHDGLLRAGPHLHQGGDGPQLLWWQDDLQTLPGVQQGGGEVLLRAIHGA